MKLKRRLKKGEVNLKIIVHRETNALADIQVQPVFEEVLVEPILIRLMKKWEFWLRLFFLCVYIYIDVVKTSKFDLIASTFLGTIFLKLLVSIIIKTIKDE